MVATSFGFIFKIKYFALGLYSKTSMINNRCYTICKMLFLYFYFSKSCPFLVLRNLYGW